MDGRRVVCRKALAWVPYCLTCSDIAEERKETTDLENLFPANGLGKATAL